MVVWRLGRSSGKYRGVGISFLHSGGIVRLPDRNVVVAAASNGRFPLIVRRGWAEKPTKLGIDTSGIFRYK